MRDCRMLIALSLFGLCSHPASAFFLPQMALVDAPTVEVRCSGYCLDLNFDMRVDGEDFLLVTASCGYRIGSPEDGRSSLYCLDGLFSGDGYVDLYDIYSWEWALEDMSRVACDTGCRVPLPLSEGSPGGGGGEQALTKTSSKGPQAATIGSWPAGLLILGKPQWTMMAPDPLRYSFYLFDSSPAQNADYVTAGLPTYCNIRLVRGQEGQVYLVNSEQGVLQLSDSSATQVIAPGKVSYASDPRYHNPATIYLGVQGQQCASFGRPILDVAFDVQGYAYVVPVVVEPSVGQAYVAAAKLDLSQTGDWPYALVQLYDDPPMRDDSEYCNHLREIEVDDAGNVYVLNAHSLNESCILWKYGPDGTLLQRVNLTEPGGLANVDDPIAMHVSYDGWTVYMASGLYSRQDPNSAAIWGLSSRDFSVVRSITVGGMQLVSSIAEDPATGALWVVGFNTVKLPSRPGMKGQFAHTPRLAKIPLGATLVQATDIAGSNGSDLALPTSIVCTGRK